MASPPSLTSVQLEPRAPSARLKSSPPEPDALFWQSTATLVTLAEPIVPVPLATEHVCPDGLLLTVTVYGEPADRPVPNVKPPLADRVRLSPPLSCRTTVPLSPERVPPTVKLGPAAMPPPDQLSARPVP